MDFPVNINRGSSTFVERMDEMKQTLGLLLKNGIKSFLQDPTVGSFIPLHTADDDLIRFGVERTVAEVPSVTLDECVITREDVVVNIQLHVTYMNNKFTVDINI